MGQFEAWEVYILKLFGNREISEIRLHYEVYVLQKIGGVMKTDFEFKDKHDYGSGKIGIYSDKLDDHLDSLIQRDILCKYDGAIEEGKKFNGYKLTEKGKDILRQIKEFYEKNQKSNQ